jgi:micrococcal nuclease
MRNIYFIIFYFFIYSSALSQNILNNNSNQVPKNIYNWQVIRVLDGDTMEIVNEFLPDELRLYVRVKGIDTPEKAPRAKCIKESMLAIKATNFTKSLIDNAQKNNDSIDFSDIKWDKYGGRILANVYINDIDLGKELIKKKLAKPYDGKQKLDWCSINK